MVKKLNKVAKALGKASKLHKKQSNIIKMTEWCWHTRVKLLNKKRKKK